jgi:hypothetical protein
MRRTALTVLATVLALGLAASMALADNADKVRSQIEIEWYHSIGGEFSLFGDVHSKKNKCERNRKVTLYHADGGETAVVVGTGTTDRTGDWEIPADLDFNAPFVASVKKRTLGGGEKKLICKGADSPPFEVEA